MVVNRLPFLKKKSLNFNLVAIITQSEIISLEKIGTCNDKVNLIFSGNKGVSFHLETLNLFLQYTVVLNDLSILLIDTSSKKGLLLF